MLLSGEKFPKGEALAGLSELRKNYEWYAFYCKHFLPLVTEMRVSKTGYQSRVQDFVTVNDEAFGLLCIHNSWDYWKEIVEQIKLHNNNKVVVSKKYQASLPQDQRIKWTKKARWTMTKVESEIVGTGLEGEPVKSNIVKCVKSWNDEGRMKFMMLGADLLDDREDNGSFDDQFLKANTAKKCAPVSLVKVNHDDFAVLRELNRAKRLAAAKEAENRATSAAAALLEAGNYEAI